MHKRQELVEQINAELGGAEPRADTIIEPRHGTGSDIHLPALFDKAKMHEIIVIAYE